MDNTKIQIHDDYCKETSQEEISAILDRISAILTASYHRKTSIKDDLEDAS